MKYLLLLFTLVFIGCAADRQTENYNLQSVTELNLTQSSHQIGYGKNQCFGCHLPQNIHQINRINAPNFYLAAPLVAQQGLASCSGCHGTNGVP